MISFTSIVIYMFSKRLTTILYEMKQIYIKYIQEFVHFWGFYHSLANYCVRRNFSESKIQRKVEYHIQCLQFIILTIFNFKNFILKHITNKWDILLVERSINNLKKNPAYNAKIRSLLKFLLIRCLFANLFQSTTTHRCL